MNASRGHFARGPQAIERGAAACVSADPAHVVVRGRRHWNEHAHWVDAGRHAACVDGGKARGKALADCRARVEKRAAPGSNLREYATCDDIAWRQIAVGMNRQHEPLAGAVDQNGAFAPQGLARERCRIVTDRYGSWMKLH